MHAISDTPELPIQRISRQHDSSGALDHVNAKPHFTCVSAVELTSIACLAPLKESWCAAGANPRAATSWDPGPRVQQGAEQDDVLLVPYRSCIEKVDDRAQANMTVLHVRS
jgi:hypothetical protein